jgi:hypothetical protein
MVLHAIHETFINPFTYMPLIFLFYNKSLNTSRPFEKGVPHDNPTLKSVGASPTDLNKSGIVELATGNLKYILLTGLFMGIAILCGHPQVSLYMFFIFLLFGLYKIFFKIKENNYKINVSLFRFIFIAAIPFIIGIMLGAIQLLPSMTLSELSERAEMSYEQSLYGSLNYHNLFCLFSPDFFGHSNAAEYGVPYWGHKASTYLYCESCIYVGLSALVFGLFGIIALWKKSIVKFLATISLLSILFSLGDNFIIYKLFYNFVPGFDKFRFIGRFGAIVLAFSFSLLGAYGFDYFIKNADNEKVKKFIKYFIVIISGFIVLWLLYQIGLFKGIADAYKDEKLYDNSTFQLLKTVIILLTLLGLVILYKVKVIPQKVILPLFILLSFADYYIFGSEQNNGDIPLEKYFPHQEIVALIKEEYSIEELYRVKAIEKENLGIFANNQGMVDFIFLIDGDTPLSLKDRFPPYRTNELMNVRAVATLDTITNEIYFEYNENYAPRVWMSYYSIVESSLEKVAKILEDTTFEIAKKAIIDQEPEIFIDTNLVNIADYEIYITFYEINEITLSVQTSENGILILSEVYYPNWKVFVDGVEKTILRCDYSLRGVAIEKGNHTVVFKYVDKDFQLGAIITLFALAIIIGGFILARPR